MGGYLVFLRGESHEGGDEVRDVGGGDRGSGGRRFRLGGAGQLDRGDAKACVAKCIKGGDHYVLVVGDKTYKIANQKFADLVKFGGMDAVVTGELKDDTITVSKIVAPKAKSK
jgi:hypothetical protein